jgi:hypothetical protein
VAPPAPPPAPPAWPTSRDGLAFSFESGWFKTPVIAFGKDGQQFMPFVMARQGTARYDRNWGMVFDTGWFEAPRAADFITASCQASGAFTIEAMITPATLTQQGDLLSLGASAADRDLALVQDQEALRLRLRTSAGDQIVEVGKLETKPCHIAVTFGAGVVVCYRDGVEAGRSAKLDGDLSAWKGGALTFGADAAGARKWAGTLEDIAIFSRALSADELAKDYTAVAARLAARTPVPVLRVKAKLLAKSETPELQNIVPYVSALVVCEYAVEQVVEGACEARTIRVAQWGLMNKAKLKLGDRALGTVVEMRLEPFAANKQLEPEFLADDLPTSEAPMFCDLGTPQ